MPRDPFMFDYSNGLTCRTRWTARAVRVEGKDNIEAAVIATNAKAAASAGFVLAHVIPAHTQWTRGRICWHCKAYRYPHWTYVLEMRWDVTHFPWEENTRG